MDHPYDHRDASSHQHGSGHHSAADSQDLAELLDLDAVVLHSYWAEVTAWVRRLSAGTPRRRILDLGAGTGTGTIALAQRFGSAHVVALDMSEDRLTRVRVKALNLNLAERVRTLRADLDVAWPVIDPVDLVWASMSLHEMADPDRLLTDTFATLRPGGMLAVAEMDAHLRFLPDDIGLGSPGLETRCLAAVSEASEHAMPFGSDWAPSLERAGFVIVAKRTFDIGLPPPHPSATGLYAHGWFLRVRSLMEGRLNDDDLATLDTLLESDSTEGLLRREDLHVHGSRTAWMARRAE